jgi:hypothetical protein
MATTVHFWFDQPAVHLGHEPLASDNRTRAGARVEVAAE